MRLVQSLSLADKQVVTLVGGGGKTSAIFRLARELGAGGRRAIVTTTTRIFLPAQEEAEAIILEPDPERLVSRVSRALRAHAWVVAGAGLDQGKIIGVLPELVARLVTLPEVDAVLVEADGSHGRSLKAPGPHEPPVPSCTTVLIPVAGVDVIGQRLDREAVHRPELVARLTGLAPSAVITPWVVATVLAHPEGGLKGRPPRARVIPLLNKVEGEERLSGAREVAEMLLGSPEIECVLLGCVASDEPIREVHRRVATVVPGEGPSA